MVLGSVGSGIAIGLSGAVLVWTAGHSPAVVLLAYSVAGSLGTLAIAAVAGMGRAAERHPDR
jgi:hypothetical protein